MQNLKPIDSKRQYASFWLYLVTRVEFIHPRKKYNQINNSVSKDKLSNRVYANTDKICMYLGQHYPHTTLGTVVGQNINYVCGIPSMQNCTINVLFLSISDIRYMCCFFFLNNLFTFISLVLLSFSPFITSVVGPKAMSRIPLRRTYRKKNIISAASVCTAFA